MRKRLYFLKRLKQNTKILYFFNENTVLTVFTFLAAFEILSNESYGPPAKPGGGGPRYGCRRKKSFKVKKQRRHQQEGSYANS